MSTTADLLNKLVSQKNTLADNLVEKGVEATHDETLETLVPKVLEISSGSTEEGLYPISDDCKLSGDIVLPNNVTSINGNSLIHDNSNITSVTCKNGSVTVGVSAFNNCKNIVSLSGVSISGSVPNNAFQLCSKLETIETMSIINVVGSSSFYNCSSLRKINFGGQNIKINSNAFYNCNNLTDVTIEEGSTFSLLSNYGFYGVPLSDEVVSKILNGCTAQTSYGQHLFDRNNALTSVTIPKNMSRLSSDMFSTCENLETFIYSSSNNSNSLAPAMLANCPKLKNVILPSNVDRLGSYGGSAWNNGNRNIFFNSPNIENLTIGSGWNVSFHMESLINLTHDSLINVLNSLKDLSDTTAKTLYLGETNLAKLAEEEKAIATNKNWILS